MKANTGPGSGTNTPNIKGKLQTTSHWSGKDHKDKTHTRRKKGAK